MYHRYMRMSNPTASDGAPERPRLVNKLPGLMASSHLSADEVASRVEALLGCRLDRRTLRRYLSGEPVIDATAVTLAAICRAMEVRLDDALELVAEDPLELALTAGGRRLVTPEVGPTPSGWGELDPAWGDVVGPFLQDRRARF